MSIPEGPVGSDLVRMQEYVVYNLQERLWHATKDKAPSGHLKDDAIALGVAVDKLDLLRRSSRQTSPSGA